jgi:protein-S-isoprenylcysteine O-methyltransferase Ste14
MNWKLASVVAFVLLVACLLWLARIGSLLGHGPFAIAAQVGAILLMIWARFTFGVRSFHAAANPTEGGIVTTGPYHFIRHPIYAAVFYFIAAGAISQPGIQSLTAVALASLMLFIRLRSEEILLIGSYPEYATYAKQTSRIIPFMF